MFRRLSLPFTNFFKQQLKSSTFKIPFNPFLRRAAIPLTATTYYALFPATIHLQQQSTVNRQPIKQVAQQKIKKQSFWSWLWHTFVHILRFCHLLIIFSPPILLFPLALFKKTQAYWRKCFVKAVQRAGVVFIKAFQYMSHRRDIIGPQLAKDFEYLRQNAPKHDFQTTKRYFKKQYNKNIQDIFEEFDPQPIASGSVSQVYKAKYKGKKVAVKVRHPQVDKYITRDINLLFYLSYFASFFSPSMQIPISQSSLKRTLTQQIDFTFQMQNLNTFRQMFKYRQDVKFPFPYEQSTKDMVLVQQFVQGVPVTFYEHNKHPLNKVIARMGSTTFFQMLMKNNFIHADCHGGNIFIEIKEQSYNMFTQIWQSIKLAAFRLETKVKAMTFDTQKIKKLYIQSRQEQLDVKLLLRKCKEAVVVNLIDVGMVIKLNQIDKKNFVNFIKSVIQGRSQLCAQMIYNLSNFQGKKIINQYSDRFKSYYQQLAKCFSVLDGQQLDDLKGIQLFREMLNIIRQNRMKLDGEFATLLTNMMVLEAIAKDIDPQINILKCAFPYFKYVEGFGVYSK